MAETSVRQEETLEDETGLEFVTADFAELCMWCFGFACLVAIAAAALWYLVYAPADQPGRRPPTNYTRLLEESINRSISPCDNFYRFVCSGWEQSGHGRDHLSIADAVGFEAMLDAMAALEEAAKTIPARSSSLRTSVEPGERRRARVSRRTDGRRPEDPLLRGMIRPASPRQATATESAVLKAASLFESCKEVVAEKRSASGELTEFVKNYTGFPKVRPQAAASVIGTMIELSLTWKIHTMFLVDVFADLDEDARPTIAIGANVELHGWLLQAQLLQASGKLEDFFFSQLQALEGFRSSQAEELLIAIAQADSLIALPLVAMERSPPDAMTYDQLPTFVPCVRGQEWVDAVNKQTEPYFRVEVGHHVRIDNATMQLVGRILNDSARPLSAPLFLGWTMLRQLAPRAYHRAATFLYKDKTTYDSACFALVAKAMPLAASYPYLSKMPTKGTRATAKTLTDDVTREFTAFLANVPWMDNVTSAATVVKIGLMGQVFVKPGFLADERALDEHYANFSARGHSYLAASLDADRSSARLAMSTLSSKSDVAVARLSHISFSPLSVNAFYDYALNAMFLPAALMRMPYVDEKVPMAFNYAGLGAVVGHETMHAFDHQGRTRDGLGKHQDWWSPEALEKYEEKVECLRRAYGFNATETVADFASLPAVLGAYRLRSSLRERETLRRPTFLEFSGEQLFYLNYCFKLCSREQPGEAASPYLTDEERCNVPLKNLKEFADAFQCNKGAEPMNVADKCSFWDLALEQIRVDPVDDFPLH
ncbi:hypothetical protein HPB48_026228 [Haemaphysalis longicornis]|uniref:Uncharacterized protein n=1 Tax=Haemaphysalis longicornis TaxID=44386 RepID=A0A9J6H951_HAELO|nr:hypothetical protein HPB48_026228 [Haemaphysalis longicornis]